MNKNFHNTLLTNPYLLFEKHRNTIIEKFITYYGEEYRNIIINQFNNTYINLYSSVEEEYLYAMNNQNKICPKILMMIEQRFSDHQDLKCQYLQSIVNKFITSVGGAKKHILLDAMTKDKNKFDAIFGIDDCDGFDDGLIDAFSERNLSRLDCPDTLAEHVEAIKQNQITYQNYCHELNIPDLTRFKKIVNAIQHNRQVLQHQFEDKLILDGHLGQKVTNEIQEMLDYEIDSDELYKITNLPHEFGGKALIVEEFSRKRPIYCLISVPVVGLKNRSIISIDTFIIHETIHALEANKSVRKSGIACDDEYVTANEIRVQLITLKIIDELREDGIFIFDNPLHYRDYNDCVYEKLFPISKRFFNKYERLFNSLAFQGEAALYILTELFGESWPTYSHQLDFTYSSILMQDQDYDNVDLSDFADYDDVNYLIKDMEQHYEKQERKLRQEKI